LRTASRYRASVSGGETHFLRDGEVYRDTGRNHAALFGSFEEEHYVRPRPQRFFDDPATVIASICQQILGRNSIDQGTSLCTISNGTCCDKKSDRHTMRIHGQMYFGVEPPFVRAMS